VGWASGKDGAIIDISGEPMELPGLRKSEEGYEVDGGQDGGQRGTLRYAVVQDSVWSDLAID